MHRVLECKESYVMKVCYVLDILLVTSVMWEEKEQCSIVIFLATCTAATLVLTSQDFFTGLIEG